jgi:hypothetical protein
MRLKRWAIILALALLLSNCSAPTPESEPGAWFVEVEREGGYWLGPEVLSKLGFDPLRDSFPPLTLTFANHQIPILPQKTPSGWGFFFFAPHQPSRYSGRTAFRLEKGRTPSIITCPKEESLPLEANPSQSALAFLHLEEDNRYLPQAEAEIPWLWAPLYAPGSLTFTITLTEPVSGPVTVTLRIWSHSSFPPAPDHLLRLWWDNRLVGEWEWDGMGMKEFEAGWKEEETSTNHTLVLENLLPEKVEASVIWLDSLEIAWQRKVEVDGSEWEALGQALKVEKVPPGAYAFDITEPLHPQGCPIPPDGLIPTYPGHRYWIGIPQRAPAPEGVRPAKPLHREEFSGVEYLAIAPPDFHSALLPLLDYRRKEGLKVGLADPQAIYDSFGDGRPSPEAIRKFVMGLPSLRYLLLVGDASSEPGGYDGGALRVVTPFTRTSVLGETPADILLGIGPSGEMKVAVGRFPASSSESLALMVNKTLRWEREQNRPTVLLLWDDEPEFQTAAEEVSRLLEPSGLPIRLAETRTQALEALGGGPVWLNYFGHGSLTGFGDERILEAKDSSKWREPALVAAWSCLAAHFIHPAQESMAEAWLRSPGGAVAFIGPVGETPLAAQMPFALAFYRAILQGKRLGDAWLEALKSGNSQDVAFGYVLLGDPALRVAK